MQAGLPAFSKKVFLYHLAQLKIRDTFYSDLVISLSQVHWNKASCFCRSTKAERTGKCKATVL